jgi:hypothetical protein
VTKRPPYLEAIAVVFAALFVGLVIAGAFGPSEPVPGPVSMRTK